MGLVHSTKKKGEIYFYGQLEIARVVRRIVSPPSTIPGGEKH